MGEDSPQNELCAVLSALDEAEVAALHLDREYPIDAVYAGHVVSDYVLREERQAEKTIEKFSEDVGAEPVALLSFKRTSIKVSSVRMAVFTGRRFLYSSVGGSVGSTLQDPSIAALANRGGADLKCGVPELELFLQVIRGTPPEGVSLRTAAALFFVIEYAMATAVHDMWIEILDPLLKQLSKKQMAFITACILRVSQASCHAENSPLALLLSYGALSHDGDGGEDDGHSDRDGNGHGGGTESDDDSDDGSDDDNDNGDHDDNDDSHAAHIEDGNGRSGDDSVGTADDPANGSHDSDDDGNDDDVEEAAMYAVKVLSKAGCGGDSHGQLLLQICRSCRAPCWLRVASVAATAQLEEQALPGIAAESSAELQRVLEDFGNVDYSAVFAAACVRATEHAQRLHVASMMRAVMQHMTQLKQLQASVMSGDIVDSPALKGPVGVSASPQLVCQPLLHAHGFMLCARMQVGGKASRTRRGYALSVVMQKSSTNSDQVDELPALVPNVRINLINLHKRAQGVKYVLGFMPAVNAGRVACVLHELQNRLDTQGFGLESGIVCSTPVFMRSGKMKIPAMTHMRRWMKGHALTHQKWKEVAEADWRDDSVKGKDLVAFCFLEENE